MIFIRNIDAACNVYAFFTVRYFTSVNFEYAPLIYIISIRGHGICKKIAFIIQRNRLYICVIIA